MRRRRMVLYAVVAAASVLISGCTAVDVRRLAGDNTTGRNNDTPGSAIARQYLLEQLEQIADPVGGSYEQAISLGTNVLGVISGTDLADEYVIVGAHYDHVGSSCTSKEAGDSICNGATDNATGVAAALAIGRDVARNRTRRSVILAFWDREEDGLVGSRHYTQNPLVPLADTVAYVNFDIQGANLLPSLRANTFAVGSETGGTRFQDIVRSAAAPQELDTTLFSAIFGQGRSDYANFINVDVPTVFFTDSTGPCYHTNQDEVGIVDFGKLDEQIATSLAVTRELADTNDPPTWTEGLPVVTFDDLVGFADVVNLAYTDRDRFSEADQETITRIRDEVNALVAEGRDAFGSDDVSTLIGDAVTAVNLLTRGPCDGFLAPE